MRMGIAKDIRIGKMNIKEALLKWDAPRRRVNEWLREYDAGAYSDLPDFFTQEELKKMKKLPGGGRPLKDPQLEQKLINYYNELKEELYPICSELLTYECLAHNENFLGGPKSPNFKMRIADFLTLSRTAGPVGPPAGLVGPLFDIAFEIHFDEVGMFFFEI